MVGIHLARHDRLAQTPGRVDDDVVSEGPVRIGRQHHPGASRFEHPLQHDRNASGTIDVAALAIHRGAVRTVRTPALRNRRFEFGLSVDTQNGLVHARERRAIEVLGDS